MADLRDLPVVRAEAERMVSERYALAHALTLMHGTIPGGYVRDRSIDVAAELALLTNLTRPASRDAVARMVAEEVGMFPFDGTTATTLATAPGFGRFVCGEHNNDDDDLVTCRLPVWTMALCDRHDLVMMTFASCGCDTDDRRIVPGISTVTDPTEALRLIALRVLA